MDVIERWFGIAPDGGSGALELFILLALVATAVAWLVARARHRPGARHRSWRRQLAHWAELWSRDAELRDAE